MRFLLGLAISSAWLFAADAPKPALQQVRSVYLLPMGSALDQYLANRLTSSGTFVIVTDPLKADSIVTDNIGPTLQEKLDELYLPKPEPDEKESDDALAKPTARLTSFARGRGTIFIVDRNTRSVVWSTYLPAKSGRPDELDRRAREIVKRIQGDLKVK